MPYTVKAFNTATASANKMHDDTVARSLGFRGGLVPGVDVFAYLCHLPAERWGAAWLERGTMSARFASPVYDGDTVVITDDMGPDGLTLTLVGPDGITCATAQATLPASLPASPDLALWPTGPPPEDRPAASPTSLTAAPFGEVAVNFHAHAAQAYLDDIREDLALFRSDGLAHPGWLLRYANFVLSANVVLGPWIHVESAVQLYSAVVDGDRLETRAVVTDLRERGGHRFVELDVLQVVGDRVVARTAHTAIYEPRRS